MHAGGLIDRGNLAVVLCGALLRNWGGAAFGIVARTSSWIRVSTVGRNSRADGAIAKKVG